jgi:hypothetical protein
MAAQLPTGLDFDTGGLARSEDRNVNAWNFDLDLKFVIDGDAKQRFAQ